MSKFKTSYSINWEEQFAWLKKAKNLKVHCVLFVIKSLELMEVDWHRLDLIRNQKVTRRINRQILIREHSSLLTKEVLVFSQESFR